ncbi:MAG: asparagine synthetase B, partial [Lentisphaeraceae bacterium]|nr:asparagine synthetase B [Lentisphaeraceae bacterium]
MCGIAGVLSPNEATKAVIDRMNESQHHRGPDGQGIWCDESIALGHVRLAIIDLSEAAHQPFVSSDRRYVLTYNGEINNYLELRAELEKKGYDFRSESDTEVLLNSYIEWGKACLTRFNGMWAFAIWDKQEKELFCARDHFGIKPFYYHNNGQDFYFASEIKALLTQKEIVAKPNDKVIYHYLMFSLLDHSEDT